MRVCFAVIAVLCLSLSSYATEAQQTDWSGGGGMRGPVPEWTAQFDSTQGVSWRAVPGQLALASNPRVNCHKNYLDSSFDGAISVCTYDLDADGDQDVVASACFGDQVAWWRNDGGDPIQWVKQIIDATFDSPCEVFAVDLDQDGDGDVLGSAYEGKEIAWWRNDGGDPLVWTKISICDTFDGAHEVCAADMDGDGDLDVLGAAAEGDEVTLWRNDGGEPIEWIAETIDSAYDYGCRLDTADIDGDGIMDVVGTAWNAREVSWWRRDSVTATQWTKHVIASGFTGTHGLQAVDIDDDGDVDVIGAAMTLGDIMVWRNEGGEPVQWYQYPITNSYPGAGYVFTGDIDGDGDLDVAASAWSGSGITWWENTEDGLFLRHTVASGLGQTSSVCLCDLDDDGDLDVLGTAFDADQLAWWEVSDFVAEGELTGSILDTGSDTFASISWDSAEPAGTTVEVRVRGGDDPLALTEWSAPLANPGELPFLGWRYLQYQLRLATTDCTVSPIVTAVRVSTESAAVTPDDDTAPRLHSFCSPNPARRTTTIRFTMATEGRVALRLFDVAGRHIMDLLEEYYVPGEHQVTVELPGPGTYLCRIEAGAEVFGERIVALE